VRLIVWCSRHYNFMLLFTRCRVNASYHGNTISSVLEGLSEIRNATRPEDVPSMSQQLFAKYESLIDAKLPQDFVTSEVRTQLQRAGAIQPLNVFLRSEIDHIQTVISTVRSTMTALREAFKGQSSFTETLASVASCLQNSRCPPSWTKVS
jgi:dynein heavy chain, axonemal